MQRRLTARERDLTLLEALRLSVEMTEEKKRRAQLLGLMARKRGEKPTVMPRPIPISQPTSEDEDREHGLEIYCEQLVGMLRTAPRLPARGRKVIEFPSDQIDRITRQLNYLLVLRKDPKAA